MKLEHPVLLWKIKMSVVFYCLHIVYIQIVQIRRCSRL